MDLTRLTLETARLRLVPRSLDHAEAIFREYRDPVANTPSRRLAEALGGEVQRTWDHETARGEVRPYVAYWIPRADGR